MSERYEEPTLSEGFNDFKVIDMSAVILEIIKEKEVLLKERKYQQEVALS
jgi:hypothetical protein